MRGKGLGAVAGAAVRVVPALEGMFCVQTPMPNALDTDIKMDTNQWESQSDNIYHEL